MDLRSLFDRVPERQASRGNFMVAAFWLVVWLASLCTPLSPVPGRWEFWSMAAIVWLWLVPLATALAALFGPARWGMLGASAVYILYWLYLMAALSTWSGS